jgi:alkanesulfonate monooxygenase SsuD/methylene tetrahydromethanopterin reductase-like flavin-dependent oxidoreductase (luciferase family)
MKVGLMLPTFAEDPSAALDVARLVDARGLDGVFCFDHLWPMGSPGRPALWSFGVLAAVAAVTDRVSIGPLVARIDLFPEDELVDLFATLAAIAGLDRVIAALGAGDRLSAAENLAYGLARRPADERLAMVARVADRLRALSIVTWIGGNSPAVAGLAASHADAHNVWQMEAGEDESPVTWAGQVLVGRDGAELADLQARFGERDGLLSGTVDEVAARLSGLRATWCVCAPLDYLAQPTRAAETVCLVSERVM